jgi:hypothetical protein
MNQRHVCQWLHRRRIKKLWTGGHALIELSKLNIKIICSNWEKLQSIKLYGLSAVAYWSRHMKRPTFSSLNTFVPHHRHR